MNIVSELDDRKLRFDGISIVSAEVLKKFILDGVDISKLRVEQINEELEQFLLVHPNIDMLSMPNSDINFSWDIPEDYKNINFTEYIYSKFQEKLINRSEEYTNLAIERTLEELELFEKNNLIELSKAIIYVLDMFRKNNVLWGVGRGSSSASFIFYLLGLHSVDCIKYGIDIREFIK